MKSYPVKDCQSCPSMKWFESSKINPMQNAINSGIYVCLQAEKVVRVLNIIPVWCPLPELTAEEGK